MEAATMTPEAPRQIVLTLEQYESLKSQAPRDTITIDRAEYDRLVSAQADVARVAQERDRFAARMRELESLLSREAAEHKQEYDALMKAYNQARGGQAPPQPSAFQPFPR